MSQLLGQVGGGVLIIVSLFFLFRMRASVGGCCGGGHQVHHAPTDGKDGQSGSRGQSCH